MIEKPSTICHADSCDLVRIAEENELAFHENYMFIYHDQIRALREIIDSGEIGSVRLMRADFGFPLREKNDFRYSKNLGGGALLDAGGYTLRLATLLLGNTAHVEAARLCRIPGYEVDMYGCAQLSNEKSETFQVAFGMDCEYRCSLEVWGSQGKLTANRIFTAPDGFRPMAYIEHAGVSKEIQLPADDSFGKSIQAFLAEISNEAQRKKSYEDIITQARLVEELRVLSGANGGVA